MLGPVIIQHDPAAKLSGSRLELEEECPFPAFDVEAASQQPTSVGGAAPQDLRREGLRHRRLDDAGLIPQSTARRPELPEPATGILRAQELQPGDSGGPGSRPGPLQGDLDAMPSPGETAKPAG